MSKYGPSIVCSSAGYMPKSHKIIVMARFDKDMLQPDVEHDKSFEKLQDKAFKAAII